jgi:DNA polymerase-3 subunit delta'
MSDWIGQDRQQATMIEALAGQRMPHAWLLAGPRGIGKAGFAARAASFLVDDGDLRAKAGAVTLDIAAQSRTRHLIDSGAHPEYLWLKRETTKAKRSGDADESDAALARNITVDQVRELIGRMRVKPAISRWRAVVIDSIDDMERGAANALLKTLEEPPANTVFFLVSHSPGRLLPTIVSRCRLLRFAPLDDGEMRRFLAARVTGEDATSIDLLVQAGQGSPGRALEFADLGLQETTDLLTRIIRDGDRDNQLRAQLAKTLAGAGQKRKFDAMLHQATMLAGDAARAGQGDRRLRALDTRQRLLSLARDAARGDDPALIAFAAGTALAAMAGAS